MEQKRKRENGNGLAQVEGGAKKWKKEKAAKSVK